MTGAEVTAVGRDFLRIGALEMQTLNVTDNREWLVHHLDSVARLPSAAPAVAELLGDGKPS